MTTLLCSLRLDEDLIAASIYHQHVSGDLLSVFNEISTHLDISGLERDRHVTEYPGV